MPTIRPAWLSSVSGKSASMCDPEPRRGHALMSWLTALFSVADSGAA
ncbi:MAG: hypothetical protein ACPGVA_17290 [Pikeienuella sp.]